MPTYRGFRSTSMSPDQSAEVSRPEAPEVLARIGALAVIAVLLAVAGCGAPTPETAPAEVEPGDGGAIVYRVSEISAESAECPVDEVHCARVKVSSLETDGGGTAAARDTVDRFLTHDLVSRLRSFLPQDVGDRTFEAEELTAAFLAEHRTFVTDFPDSPAQWDIHITTEVLYNTESVTTLDIFESSYTGGAHPNSRRRLVSFDVATGQLLGIDDLVSDAAALKVLTEQQLRADHGLGAADDLGAAGFWFPEDEFYLPDNFGVISEGIHFHWDPYEIAPYSAGPIDVIVPVDQISGIVDRRFW